MWSALWEGWGEAVRRGGNAHDGRGGKACVGGEQLAAPLRLAARLRQNAMGCVKTILSGRFCGKTIMGEGFCGKTITGESFCGKTIKRGFLRKKVMAIWAEHELIDALRVKSTQSKLAG